LLCAFFVIFVCFVVYNSSVLINPNDYEINHKDHKAHKGLTKDLSG